MSFFFLIFSYLMSALSHLLLAVVLYRVLLTFPFAMFFLRRFWRLTAEWTQKHQKFLILKYDDQSSTQPNPLYRKAVWYISSLPSVERADNSSIVGSSTQANAFKFHVAPGQKVYDTFSGARITWLRPAEGAERVEILFRREDRVRILRPYLQFIEYEALKEEGRQRDLQLFEQPEETLWLPLPLTHPCDMGGFKVLARSYLGLSNHPFFDEIRGEFIRGARLSLAEVSNIIVDNRRRPLRAMRRVMNALQEARINAEAAQGERAREAVAPPVPVRVSRLERVKRLVRIIVPLRRRERREANGIPARA